LLHTKDLDLIMKSLIFSDEELESGWPRKFHFAVKKTNPVLASVILHALVLVIFSLTFIYSSLTRKAHTLKVRRKIDTQKYIEEKKVMVPKIQETPGFRNPDTAMELLMRQTEIPEESKHKDAPGPAALNNKLNQPVSLSEIISALNLPDAEDDPMAFFGSKINSKRILFVIDTSGSMDSITRYPTNDNSGTFDPKTGKYYIQISKLALALRELRKCVSALDSNTKFNILAFSGSVRKPFSQMEFATPENITDAIIFIGTISSGSGGTDIMNAFKEVFKEEDVDTVFLLSDGAPSTGTLPNNQAKNLSSNQIHIKSTLSDIDNVNSKRKLNIHTFGLQDGNNTSSRSSSTTGKLTDEEEFMKKLAESNSGMYTPVK